MQREIDIGHDTKHDIDSNIVYQDMISMPDNVYWVQYCMPDNVYWVQYCMPDNVSWAINIVHNPYCT